MIPSALGGSLDPRTGRRSTPLDLVHTCRNPPVDRPRSSGADYNKRYNVYYSDAPREVVDTTASSARHPAFLMRPLPGTLSDRNRSGLE